MRLLSLVCAFTSSLLTTDAFAAWHVADSDHFVIYADQSESDIRRFSERLERYRSAMASVFPVIEDKPSPSNRVTVYIVKNPREVEKLFGDSDRDIAGFYIPRAGGSIAVVSQVHSTRKRKISFSEQILLHEYAHHFMYENARYLVPGWYTEGFAEYFSTAKFESDGTVGLGMPSEMRAYEVLLARDVPLAALLDSQVYADRKSKRDDNFYGRSWLLFHYLFSDRDRLISLVSYIDRLNRGEPELEAAVSAFGDLRKLDLVLDKYLRQRNFLYINVPASKTDPGEIRVRELSEGHGAIMPLVVRSKRGVNPEQAAEIVIEARVVAAMYPDDPAVQAALAEAEFDSGNNEAAIIAADNALASDPANMNAWVQKGYALARTADISMTAADWDRVRQHFVAVNKIEVNHPVPLIYYFRSFLAQNRAPTVTAVAGIERALELAPYDTNLRMMVGQRQMQEQRFADAVYTLSRIAYNPHIPADHPAIEMLEAARQGIDSTPVEPMDTDAADVTPP